MKEYLKSYRLTLDAMAKHGDNSFERIRLSCSRDVFKEKLDEQARQMAWLSATMFSREKQGDLYWLLQVRIIIFIDTEIHEEICLRRCQQATADEHDLFPRSFYRHSKRLRRRENASLSFLTSTLKRVSNYSIRSRVSSLRRRVSRKYRVITIYK